MSTQNAETVRPLTARGSTVEGDGWRVTRGRTKWEWWVRGDNEWHFIDDFATKKEAIAAAVRPPTEEEALAALERVYEVGSPDA